MQPALYVNLVKGLTISSPGIPQTYVLTPEKYWAMGLNLAEFVSCLRVEFLSPGGGEIALKWQYSFDGLVWLTGSPIGTPRTAAGDYSDVFNTNTELLPFVRVIVDIKDTGAGTTPRSALISMWGYYKFRA